MIDRGDISIEGNKTNDDHGAFKKFLPKYEKGESSLTNNKGKNVNYVYDTTINHISIVDNQIIVIKINDKQDNLLVNVTTRGKSKFILKGSTSKTPVAPSSQYNIVDQLKNIPT